MSDNNERHLPLFQKKAVYEMFRSQHKILYPSQNVPSLSYFYSTWKTFCSHVKVRRVQRFTKCTECEYIRDSMAKFGSDPSKAEPLVSRRKTHIEMVARERREYQSKCEQAALFPSQFTSMIIDGADQSGYGLLHFTVNTKATNGHSLKVKLAGVLEHGVRKHLSLYTMTSEFETGANHIIECLHRTLQRKSTGSSLQGTLYLQVDNCTRENKNRFLFCYLESLVAWGVFKEVYISFLPVGHTHSDIDQAFSCTSRRLRSNNAVTMEDLMHELRQSYTPEPSVSRLLHIANFSGLCKEQSSISNVENFSKYRYFRFFRCNHRSGRTMTDSGHGKMYFITACECKVFCNDQWEELQAKPAGVRGFTIRPPDLCMTPGTKTFSPPNRKEVLERLRSEETRINSPSKLQELYELTEHVYNERTETFHWNLQVCFEYNGIYRPNARSSQWNEDHDESEQRFEDNDEPLSNLSYSINHFVAVNGEGCTAKQPFWLGQILECKRNTGGVINTLIVRWYEVCGSGNAWNGRYSPATLVKGNSRKEWKVFISVDSIIEEFPSITNNRLRAGVEREIRSGLASLQ